MRNIFSNYSDDQGSGGGGGSENVEENRRQLPPTKIKKKFSIKKLILLRRNKVAGEVQMTSQAGQASTDNLEKFYADVDGVIADLASIYRLRRSLEQTYEKSKVTLKFKSLKRLRSKTDAEAIEILRYAKLIKLKLEALDRANAANRSLPDCGPGSSTDRARTQVVAGLRKKLKESLDQFQSLKERVVAEFKKTAERRYFTVTGQQADEETLDLLISMMDEAAEGTILQKIVQEDHEGRDMKAAVEEMISEMRERHGAATEVEKSLEELKQLFGDMAVVVNAQGDGLDDIEAQLQKANSFLKGGTDGMETARSKKRSSRKWIAIAIVAVIIVLAAILIPLLVVLL